MTIAIPKEVDGLIKQFAPGVTLGNLSFDQFKDPSFFREIAEKNGINIFKDLPIGKDFSIPSQKELQDLAIGMARSKLEGVLGGEVGATLKKIDGLAKTVTGKSINEQIKLIDWLY